MAVYRLTSKRNPSKVLYPVSEETVRLMSVKHSYEALPQIHFWIVEEEKEEKPVELLAYEQQAVGKPKKSTKKKTIN